MFKQGPNIKDLVVHSLSPTVCCRVRLNNYTPLCSSTVLAPSSFKHWFSSAWVIIVSVKTAIMFSLMGLCPPPPPHCEVCELGSDLRHWLYLLCKNYLFFLVTQLSEYLVIWSGPNHCTRYLDNCIALLYCKIGNTLLEILLFFYNLLSIELNTRGSCIMSLGSIRK